MGVDPSEKATKFAMAMSEGLNLLGVFLCGPALSKLREQAPELLRRWETEYAPVFRQIDMPDSSGDPAATSASVHGAATQTRPERPRPAGRHRHLVVW